MYTYIFYIKSQIVGKKSVWNKLFSGGEGGNSKLFLVKIRIFLSQTVIMLFPLFHQQMHTQVTVTLPFQLNKNYRIKPLHFSVFLLFYFQELLSKVFIFAFLRNGGSKGNKESQEGSSSLALKILSLFTLNENIFLQWLADISSPSSKSYSTRTLEEGQIRANRCQKSKK